MNRIRDPPPRRSDVVPSAKPEGVTYTLSPAYQRPVAKSMPAVQLFGGQP